MPFSLSGVVLVREFSLAYKASSIVFTITDLKGGGCAGHEEIEEE
jgi:hypothetical protein